jgi:hypothetical protein
MAAVSHEASAAQQLERDLFVHDPFCFLCTDGAYPSNSNHLIDANGKTCEALDAEMVRDRALEMGYGQERVWPMPKYLQTVGTALVIVLIDFFFEITHCLIFPSFYSLV